MVWVVASDLHGSLTWTQRLFDACEAEQASHLLLLGDLLYHGPRNPLPDGYDPSEVAELLNRNAESIMAIRGNCDAEVDSMVLNFPLMESAFLMLDNRRFVCTHGHKFNDEQLPPLGAHDVLLFGHTHVYRLEKRDGFFVMNPGSVSLPKLDRPHTYLVYRDGRCSIKDFGGGLLESLELE
jgi:hypothetical protein